MGKMNAELGSPARPARWLVGLLLCVASSRLPVHRSVARFGGHPSKKSKTCPAERSVTGLRTLAAPRAGGAVQASPPLDLDDAPESSFRGISPATGARLLAGSRRPDYLNSFQPASTHGDLPPPGTPS